MSTFQKLHISQRGVIRENQSIQPILKVARLNGALKMDPAYITLSCASGPLKHESFMNEVTG